MKLALRKRPVSTSQVDAAVERIEETLLNLGLREVAFEPNWRTGHAGTEKLDKIAYVRFASVYRTLKISMTLKPADEVGR